MDKQTEIKTKKINRLCEKYSRKLISTKAEISSILINFAEDYNKIWEGVE